MTEQPHDIAAESAILGACMQNPSAAQHLHPEHMYRPAHQIIGEAIRRLNDSGQPCDVLTVKDDLTKHKTIEKVGGPIALSDHVANLPVVAGVSHYAAIVAGHYERRRLIEVATRAQQRAWNLETEVEDAADAIADDLNALRDRHDDDLASVMTLAEFVGRTLPPRRYVLDALLAAGERLVITGGEGLGKSVLLRQFATCSAAGLHPFNLTPTETMRVLVLDMENPEDIMIDGWGVLDKAAKKRGRPVPDGNLMIDRRSGGLDLARVDDRRWLTRRVELVRPDLLVLGPAYKLYVGGGNEREESLARLVTSVLDGLRESVGCAVILEHHAPHKAQGVKSRDMRPVGSSLWLRWPEFGMGLRLADESTDHHRVAELQRWRGPRAERSWPERVEQGGAGGMPWVSTIAAARWSA